MRLSAAKGRLDRSLNTAEQELQQAQQQILLLQVRVDHKPKLHHLPITYRSRGGCRSRSLAAPQASVFVLTAVSHLWQGVRRSSCVLLLHTVFTSNICLYSFDVFVNLHLKIRRSKISVDKWVKSGKKEENKHLAGSTPRHHHPFVSTNQ